MLELVGLVLHVLLEDQARHRLNKNHCTYGAQGSLFLASSWDVLNSIQLNLLAENASLPVAILDNKFTC
jgi:hypothetical protein